MSEDDDEDDDDKSAMFRSFMVGCSDELVTDETTAEANADDAEAGRAFVIDADDVDAEAGRALIEATAATADEAVDADVEDLFAEAGIEVEATRACEVSNEAFE